jgi:regulatory protein
VPPEGAAEDIKHEALGRAVRFIEHRARSKGETRNRLLRWGYGGEVCDQVLDHLESCGLLDDYEFARVFLGEMLRKGFGFNGVRMELLRKKLDRDLVEEVLVEYPLEEELNRAVELACPLAEKLKTADSATMRRKMVGYLARRGYSGEVAREACRQACDVDT